MEFRVRVNFKQLLELERAFKVQNGRVRILGSGGAPRDGSWFFSSFHFRAPAAPGHW